MKRKYEGEIDMNSSTPFYMDPSVPFYTEPDSYFVKYFIAYIDILGYKSIFDGSFPYGNIVMTECGEMKFISHFRQNNPIVFSLKIEGYIEMAKESMKYYSADIKQKVFSDNFLFCTKDHWLQLVDFTAVLQSILVREGVLIRGALCWGDLHYSNDFISGTGLIKVVEAEKQAKMPKIVIDNSFIQAATTDIEKINPSTMYDFLAHMGLLMKNGIYDAAKNISKPNVDDVFKYMGLCDFDDKWGNVFIDYINKQTGDVRASAYHSLEYMLFAHRFWVLYNALAIQEDSIENVLPKLKWCLFYHNSYCEKHRFHKYLIDEDFFNELCAEQKYNFINDNVWRKLCYSAQGKWFLD